MHSDIVSLTVALIIQARQAIRILRTSGNEVSRRVRREHREVAVSPEVSSYVTSCSQENIH